MNKITFIFMCSFLIDLSQTAYSQSINLGIQFNNSGGRKVAPPIYAGWDGRALNQHIPSGDEIQQLNAPVRDYRNRSSGCGNSPKINFNVSHRFSKSIIQQHFDFGMRGNCSSLYRWSLSIPGIGYRVVVED